MARLSRRRFLTVAGGVSVLLAGAGGGRSNAAPPGAARVLVLVELKGGNDGLNTLVPFADPAYYRLRPTLAVPRAQVVQLSPQLGLHPALAPLLPAWQAGEMAVIQGVGYPGPSRSHFRSIEIWDTGSASGERLAEGWIARVLAEAPRDPAAPVDAIVVDDNVQPVTGPGLRLLALRDIDTLTAQPGRPVPAGHAAAGNAALRHLLAVQHGIQAAAESLRRHLQVAPEPALDLPQTPFGGELDVAARLVLSGLPLAAIKVALPGFDTHARQRETHDRLLGVLAQALAAFRAGLVRAGRWNEVLVLTYSEFGRRAAQNGSDGTDHGTAAPQLALGGRVKGGLHGRQPSLSDLADGDMRHAVDFRDVFSTVARRWWGVRRDLADGRARLIDFV